MSQSRESPCISCHSALYIISMLLSSATLSVLLQFSELYMQFYWNQIRKIINGDAGRGGINETTDVSGR